MGVRFRLSNRMDLVACGTCGRNFNQDALTRHAPICKKNAKKKPRKQFDSQKNRLVGTEVNINDLKRKEKKGLTAKEQRAADRKNNWKAKHEELIRNIRAARGESDPEPSYGQRGGGSVVTVVNHMVVDMGAHMEMIMVLNLVIVPNLQMAMGRVDIIHLIIITMAMMIVRQHELDMVAVHRKSPDQRPYRLVI